MIESAIIESGRIRLRGWGERDLTPFHAMSRDPRVMATLGPLMTLEQCSATIDRLKGLQAAHGCTFWAMERITDGTFLGWCGVKPGPAGTPIADQMEIGWRLAHEHWGHGYAREAAQATLDWVWAETDAPLVAAITSVDNSRSWGLMERLGMVRAPEDDFDHPNVPADSPLLRHITYRINRPHS